MTKLFFSFLLIVGLLCSCGEKNNYFQPEKVNELRAPAYPLVTIDPYTSAWSFANQLNEENIRHWTGKNLPLIGALRVDGRNYRFMGVEEALMKTVLPTAALEKWSAAYTEKKPSGKWFDPNFNDAAWEKGKAAFGTPYMHNLSTAWNSRDIWVRRTFDLSQDLADETVILDYSHDDIFELYINGIEVVKTDYCWNNNVLKELPAEVKATLKPGKNVIAAHCHNRTGGGYVDFGLSVKEKVTPLFDTPAIQKMANVLPTQTYYTFECGPVQLDLIFTSPLLMDDLQLMTTPVNYISYRVKSLDGKAHDVQFYMEASPLWAMDFPGQEVVMSVEQDHAGKLTFAKVGTVEQAILKKQGDDVRIDWGYFYLASDVHSQKSIAKGGSHQLKKLFSEKGSVSMDGVSDAELEGINPVVAFSEDLGKVSAEADGFCMIGYDDLYSIQYFKENRMPYWKQDGKVDMMQALNKAQDEYARVMDRCWTFDKKLMDDAEKSGGKKYADLCALAYRQAIAAHKLVTDKEGNLLFFSKENFSNGSIGTVDVTYPSAPLFLIYNPDLLKGMLNPIFYYSESGQWQKPFAAHDVGTYPIANGQTYGGDMPVEECGNMLILTTAIAQREGHAEYAKKHWEVLTTWADYLLEEGLDPANQLCTDDFAGHLAHNANLSIKAIMGIAGYGKMAGMLGDQAIAEKYRTAAKEMTAKWVEMAREDDHFKLTFDQPGTWSQKYNLVWDRLLGFNLFPAEVIDLEIAYYLTKQNQYGLPLDSRKTYTKSDWIIWTACLKADKHAFDQLVDPLYRYANETKTRMPLSDWHETTNGNSVSFRARSVVGGYYMKMLQDIMNEKID